MLPGQTRAEPELELDLAAHSEEFVQLKESAARLQKLDPDTVMVGDSAAAICAQHQFSTDHYHVMAMLEARYEIVLEALDASDNWVASFRSTPPKTILGMEAGFHAGIRQLRRKRPLEATAVRLPSGAALVIPTEPEILRFKAYLIVNRNQVRDH